MIREIGCIKKSWAKSVRTALVFPNSYYIAMSSLSFQRLYEFINSLDGVLCDRFTLDNLESIERGVHISDYDVIIFTIPFIMDAPNVFRFINAVDRNKLICAGGIAVSANKSLFEDFVDILFTRSLEEHTPILVRVFDLMRSGGRKEEVIEYISSMSSSCESLSELNGLIPPHTVVYTKDTEFSNTHLVEVARGCVGRCRFCLSSHLEGRFKPFQYESIMEAIKGIPDEIHTIGLVGDAVFSHPDIERIVSSVIEQHKRPAFASIRIQDLSEKNYDLIIKSDIRTLTIAPEVATERMMEVVNKRYNKNLLFDILERLISMGLSNLKLYFIIGLPSEKVEDIEAMIQFVKEIRELFVDSSRKKGFIGRIRLSINNFVPSPFTPLFKFQPCSIEGIESKQAIIRDRLSDTPNVQISFMDIFDTLYQTALFRANKEDALPLISVQNPRRAFTKDPKFRAKILKLCYG